MTHVEIKPHAIKALQSDKGERRLHFFPLPCIQGRGKKKTCRSPYFFPCDRNAMARRTAGGCGAFSPITAYQRISFSSKSSTRS